MIRVGVILGKDMATATAMMMDMAMTRNQILRYEFHFNSSFFELLFYLWEDVILQEEINFLEFFYKLCLRRNPPFLFGTEHLFFSGGK
jgi:hypothetical protein